MKKSLILAIAAMSMAACEKESGCDQSAPDPKNINNINVLPEIMQSTTKTSYTGSTAAWADADAIGLYCAQSTPAAANLKVTYAATGSTWTTASAINWADGSTMHKFYAYAPWANGTPAVTAVPLPALNTQTGTMNPALDFLMSNNQGATGLARPANSTVPLTFTHVFSLIELDIKIDASIATGTTLTSFTIGSATSSDKIYTASANSKIDLTTGTITYDAAAGGTVNTVTANSGATLTTTVKPFYMLVAPGSFGTMSLGLVIKESTTNITVPSVNLGTNTFATATKYAYTVTVSRTGITITAPTITDWATGTGGSINAGL